MYDIVGYAVHVGVQSAEVTPAQLTYVAANTTSDDFATNITQGRIITWMDLAPSNA